MIWIVAGAAGLLLAVGTAAAIWLWKRRRAPALPPVGISPTLRKERFRNKLDKAMRITEREEM